METFDCSLPERLKSYVVSIDYGIRWQLCNVLLFCAGEYDVVIRDGRSEDVFAVPGLQYFQDVQHILDNGHLPDTLHIGAGGGGTGAERRHAFYRAVNKLFDGGVPCLLLLAVSIFSML